MATTKLPSLAVGDVAGCVEATLLALVSNLDDPESAAALPVGLPAAGGGDDIERLQSLARRVRSAASVLKAELRGAHRALVDYGVELPDFPRFEG